jgi:hypothetical protein
VRQRLRDAVVLEDAWSDEDGVAWKEEDEHERKKIKPSRLYKD